MMTTRYSTLLAAAAMAATLAWAPAVRAQEQPADPSAGVDPPPDTPIPDGPRAQARALGDAALKLFEQGRFIEAYQRFEEADRLLHAAPLVLYMARCKRNARQLVDAMRLYEWVLREPLPDSANSRFLAAKNDAAMELAALEPRIPTVRIRVTGAAARQVTVSIDDAPLAPYALGKPVPVDPGEHIVTAQAPGMLSARHALSLEEASGSHDVALTLTPARAGRAGMQAPAEAPSGSLVPAIVTLGVAGASIAIGIATGVVAATQFNDIKSRCIDNHCPPEDADKGAQARRYAIASTVGFAIGGAAAATGIVLAIVRPGGGGEAAALGVELEIHPSGAGMRLCF